MRVHVSQQSQVLSQVYAVFHSESQCKGPGNVYPAWSDLLNYCIYKLWAMIYFDRLALQSVCLSVRLSIRTSIRLVVHLSVCPSIWVSNLSVLTNAAKSKKSHFQSKVFEVWVWRNHDIINVNQCYFHTLVDRFCDIPYHWKDILLISRYSLFTK